MRKAELKALFTGNRELSAREVGLAALALAAFTALALAPHILNGGFYLDDWADAADYRYAPAGPGFESVLSNFWDIFSYRPGVAVYTPLKYAVLGTNVDLHLAWTAFLGLLAAVLLYGVLRTLRMPWYHAWLIAALTVVYPWFDSIRLWGSANPPPLSIALALGGLWLALWGLSRFSWRFHLLPAFLFLLSAITYEITLPVIALFGVLYTLRVGWRAARVRWGMDLVAIGAGALWVGTHTTREVSALSDTFDHAREVVTRGAEIGAWTLWPFGEQVQTGLVIGLAALVLALGLFLWFRSAAKFPAGADGWGLREWLLLAGVGILIGALGWAIFVPANPYYTPTILGETNRVNALSGYGLVMVVYAVFGVVGALVGRLVARPGAALATTLALGCLLGVAYVDTLRSHAKLWDTAYEIQLEAVDRLERALPEIAPGTMVFTTNFPGHLAPGVPIFAVDWDLTGMLQLRYRDATVAGFPVLDGRELTCDADGVSLHSQWVPPITAPYGVARLVDLGSGRAAAPRDRRHCEAVIGDFTPGQFVLSDSY